MNDGRRHRGAAERARWLAEVAEALETARLLLTSYAALSPPTRESHLLAEQVARVIAGVEALRRGGQWQVSDKPGPEWIKQPPDRLDWRA